MLEAATAKAVAALLCTSRWGKVSSRLIKFPPNWTQRFGANVVTATPPDSGVVVRYFERARPQPRFSTIVSRALAADRELHVHDVGEMVRTVTREGEYGAWVAIAGRRGDEPARRFVGAVFLDEFAAVLDVSVDAAPLFSKYEILSRRLLRAAAFRLYERPRPFFYVPPLGWQELPSSAATNWYPPDFPANQTNIVVPLTTRLADPDGVDRALELALTGTGDGLDVDAESRERIHSAGEIQGQVVRVQGKRGSLTLHRERAVFVAGLRIYRFDLETAAADRVLELSDMFAAVAGSFRPLPGEEERRQGRAFVSPPETFHHWAS